MRFVYLLPLLPLAFANTPSERLEAHECRLMSSAQHAEVRCIVVGETSATHGSWVLMPDQAFNLIGLGGVSTAYLLQHQPAERVDTQVDGTCFLQIPLGSALCIGRRLN